MLGCWAAGLLVRSGIKLYNGWNLVDIESFRLFWYHQGLPDKWNGVKLLQTG